MQPVDLVEHPEGGRFREVFRSHETVQIPRGTRRALTHIYFSLEEGEVSRFHRVASDEVWNLYRGAGIRLYLWDGSPEPPVLIELSADANCFCHVVPAGVWQAAESLSGEVLVGCSVAPGFEFSEFELMMPESEGAARLTALDPGMTRFTGGESNRA